MELMLILKMMLFLHKQSYQIPKWKCIYKLPLHIAEQYGFSKIVNALRKAQGEQAIKAAILNSE